MATDAETMESANNATEHILECARMCRDVYDCDDDVLVRERGDTLLIAIEGSDTIGNWYDNISFAMRTRDVHRGFSRYARYVQSAYDLARMVSAFDRVVVSGHSLGAAAAVLLVYNMRETLRGKDVELVLFGAPKVGGADFVARFRETCDFVRMHSYATNFDVISRLPFSLFGYVPIVESVYLPCSYRVFILTNHSMHTYISGLEGLARV